MIEFGATKTLRRKGSPSKNADNAFAPRIPDSWLGSWLIAAARMPDPAPATLIGEALAAPIGSPPLGKIARPGQRVAVLVDDYTRRTPVHLLLPPILRSLEQAGVGREETTIVVALGTHRPMTDRELTQKLGPDILDRYQVVNRPSTDQNGLVLLGDAHAEIPAWVQREVAEADLRIGLGMITPHLDAGFSGGAKILLPGVCGHATVDAFHRAGAFLPGNHLGNANAPLRRILEQFVDASTPLHFIVNVILTLAGDLWRCVAGHPVAAHRIGVGHAREVYGVTAERRYPVVVANAYPYDMDLWQSIKGVYAGDLVTADQGTLILFTDAAEGLGNYPLVPHYAGQDPNALREAITAGTVEDAMQAATGVMFGDLQRRVRLAIVSDGLSAAVAGEMGAVHFPTVEAAVTDAVQRLPRTQQAGSVALLPQAGIVLPMIQ